MVNSILSFFVVSRTHVSVTLPFRELLRTSLSQSLLSWSPSLTLAPLVAALSTHCSWAVFSQNCIPYEPGDFALAALCRKVCYLGSHTVVVQPRAKGANTIRVIIIKTEPKLFSLVYSLPLKSSVFQLPVNHNGLCSQEPRLIWQTLWGIIYCRKSKQRTPRGGSSCLTPTGKASNLPTS